MPLPDPLLCSAPLPGSKRPRFPGLRAAPLRAPWRRGARNRPYQDEERGARGDRSMTKYESFPFLFRFGEENERRAKSSDFPPYRKNPFPKRPAPTRTASELPTTPPALSSFVTSGDVFQLFNGSADSAKDQAREVPGVRGAARGCPLGAGGVRIGLGSLGRLGLQLGVNVLLFMKNKQCDPFARFEEYIFL